MTTVKRELTENEQYVMTRWSMWGSDGYPIVKRGREWYVEGNRGLGSCPLMFKTKKAAVAQWEAYIDSIIDR